jgi:hypothetical protein
MNVMKYVLSSGLASVVSVSCAAYMPEGHSAGTVRVKLGPQPVPSKYDVGV